MKVVIDPLLNSAYVRMAEWQFFSACLQLSQLMKERTFRVFVRGYPRVVQIADCTEGMKVLSKPKVLMVVGR